ncbi:MAG: hypothetical protein A2513_03465 [Sulfurimonas sp. RIFOXYD12_FULL_33_39]|uniref:response regulator transcription factor n=1 Tax=unclassified Sulfurimonas TaxID=2623549 RepID=UPI0008CC0CCC|nr:MULTISPECIES: response regulator [unclassified Sulfurimonas]OHE09201.1 MAG: hypothetical protein A2513_03465 [Sulfurimonas sp. RIFOXYD12_FULL_33_39]OHE13016.1 MAG: hypothetical protein A2530_05340 [Sulfurimonas sp. RIFOXYD2_FULL_34_21]
MDKEQVEKLRKICRNISVLYVEDDKNISDQLEKLLKKLFIKVDVEKNGFLGLRNYKENRQDIVITDISMPSMDGIEMAKRIKKINEEQIIIVTSAHNDIEYLMQLIEIGVDRFILKPIDINVFMPSITKMAISIYRERQEIFLEKQIKQQHELQLKIMNNMLIPIALIENGRFKYTNMIFNKYFLSKNSCKIEEFVLGHIFKNEKLIIMNNDTLINYLIQNNGLYSINEVGSQIFKKYKINIIKLEEENSYLLNFLNIDSLNMEFKKLKLENNYFPTREDFIHKIAGILSNSKQEYHIFCVGLRNINNFISKYGSGKINAIYSELNKSLKKDLRNEIESGVADIYIFDRNRYIILVNENYKDEIKIKLDNFGNNYSYSFGSTQAFFLAIISEKLDQNTSFNQVMENTESMLYLFD